MRNSHLPLGKGRDIIRRQLTSMRYPCVAFVPSHLSALFHIFLSHGHILQHLCADLSYLDLPTFYDMRIV